MKIKILVMLLFQQVIENWRFNKGNKWIWVVIYYKVAYWTHVHCVPYIKYKTWQYIENMKEYLKNMSLLLFQQVTENKAVSECQFVLWKENFSDITLSASDWK